MARIRSGASGESSLSSCVELIRVALETRGAEPESELHHASEDKQDTEGELNPVIAARTGPQLLPAEVLHAHSNHNRAESSEDEPAPQVPSGRSRISEQIHAWVSPEDVLRRVWLAHVHPGLNFHRGSRGSQPE